MTDEQFEREFMYQSVMSMFRMMLKKGLLTEEEYVRIDKEMFQEYRPLLGSLFSEYDLIKC